MGVENGIEWSRTLGDGAGGKLQQNARYTKAGSAGKPGVKGGWRHWAGGRLGLPREGFECQAPRHLDLRLESLWGLGRAVTSSDGSFGKVTLE